MLKKNQQFSLLFIMVFTLLFMAGSLQAQHMEGHQHQQQGNMQEMGQHMASMSDMMQHMQEIMGKTTGMMQMMHGSH